MQADVKSAYLYVPISEEIFMCQPQDYVDSNRQSWVCRMDRTLYGLHQSGRLGYYELNGVLLDIDFKIFNWCNCTYFQKCHIIPLVYVDDIVLFGKMKDLIKDVIKTKF